jgi:UDP-glucose 4-epimerase
MINWVTASTQRVLCTGALGVNGVWAVRALLHRGADVVATDAREDFSLAPELAGGAVVFRTLDVSDADAVDAAVAEVAPEVVVHMAALMPAAAQADPDRGYRVNVMGTANVLRAARAHGVCRVAFTSSKGAYGAIEGAHGHPGYAPLAEDAPLRPVSIYDHAKVASEGLGLNYAADGGPAFVALRFANIYGPGKLARHGPMSLVSRLIEDAWAGRPTRIAHGAQQRDDQVYVRDVGEAIALAALAPGLPRAAIYNVASGEAPTLAEIADAVRAAVPGADIEVGPGLDPMGLGVPYYCVLDQTRARRELGFAARYDLRSGIADYLQGLEATR